MTPLRQRMIEDLRVRGLSQNTIDSYIGAVGDSSGLGGVAAGWRPLAGPWLTFNAPYSDTNGAGGGAILQGGLVLPSRGGAQDALLRRAAIGSVIRRLPPFSSGGFEQAALLLWSYTQVCQ